MTYFILALIPAPAVDIALPNERIAIEVDGRHHFTRNSLRPLGEMFSRTTLLEARGWRIISVPYFQWAGVDEDARRTYLQNLLDRARAGQSTHPTKDENDRRSARPVVSLMQLTWTAPQPVSVPSPPQTTPHYAAAPTRVNGGGNGSQAGHVWEPPTDPR